MTVSVIEQFIKKYQTAKAYNSKEIRLTLNEAEELNCALAIIIVQNNTLSSEIINLQKRLLEEKTELDITGGKF